MNNFPIGLTYSDVLLVPKRTPLSSRGQAELKTKFTKNISLNIPLVSANMATVTEADMAIAMAREGGLGVIHQFDTIEQQVAQVRRVKRSTCYVIEEPVCIEPTATIKEAIQIMDDEHVTSLIVTDNSVVGIFTLKDYQFETNLDKQVREVMTPREKLITAKPGITLEEAKQILHKNRVEKLPLVDENKQLKGLITTKDIKKLEYWPNANRDEKGRLRVAAAVGVKDTIERATALVNANVDLLVLDIAHCHSDYAIKRIKELKETFDIDVMAGNIATAEAARDLIAAGADGLKVGIGPSPVCTTRIMSGAGIPQFTAVLNVCKVAKEHAVPVTADGGMIYPGDVVKALAAGASSIFSGSLFAGTDEAPGRIITKDGKRYKKYMGSASYDNNHNREELLRKQKIKQELDVHVEGIPILVDYKGSVAGIIQNILKGVQSGISYCGARNIPEMQRNAEFIRITPAGWYESQGRGTKMSD
ncbi:IMP dehydrogenase [Candidatus Woesearchaeota archaeon CG10_big_fil_rev_8_21_14_0_10_37_12]|nr:MAG: IMP dehydrogenase [Candidatus Woesearchaeota archaeon CG10_big_fil_rev_8_21_14_0_10_37_12]